MAATGSVFYGVSGDAVEGKVDEQAVFDRSVRASNCEGKKRDCAEQRSKILRDYSAPGLR